MNMNINKNERAKDEYRLVTDGSKLYRIHPNFALPNGIKEVFTYLGKKVYDRKGKLFDKFKNLQRIQPRINLSKVTIAIRQALGIYSK